MTNEVILTTTENNEIVEKVVGTTVITSKTDMKLRMKELGRKYFPAGSDWIVRKDSYLFLFIAVMRNGDCLSIR